MADFYVIWLTFATCGFKEQNAHIEKRDNENQNKAQPKTNQDKMKMNLSMKKEKISRSVKPWIQKV